MNQSIPADGNPRNFQPKRGNNEIGSSSALSMANTVKDSIQSRKIAVLAADGVDDAALAAMKKALMSAGAQVKIIAPRLGFLKGASGEAVKIDFSLLTTSSVLFDAVYVPGGKNSIAALVREPDAIHFINEAYKHCKAIAATSEGANLLAASSIGAEIIHNENSGKNKMVIDEGVIISPNQTNRVAAEFINVIAQHRFWSREMNDQVPA